MHRCCWLDGSAANHSAWQPPSAYLPTSCTPAAAVRPPLLTGWDGEGEAVKDALVWAGGVAEIDVLQLDVSPNLRRGGMWQCGSAQSRALAVSRYCWLKQRRDRLLCISRKQWQAGRLEEAASTVSSC